MSASMRPVVRALLRSRLPLPLLPLFAALMIRANHSGPMDWIGSDLQAVLAAIVYLTVIPMLSIVLGTGWLRGEVGPWSWALARPIARWRWLGATLLVDLATLLVAVLLSYLVIGDLPDRWIGPWTGDGTRELGYAAVLAIVHCGAAFAGARGSSAIGGAMSAAVFLAIALLGQLATVIASSTAADLQFRGHFALNRLGRDLLNPWRLDDPLSEINALATALCVATAAVIVVLRTGRSLPARPRLRVTTPFALAIVLTAGFAAVTTTLVFSALVY